MVSVHHKLWSSPGAQFGAHVAAQSMLQAPLMDDMDQSFSKAPKNSYIKHSLESTKKQSPREAMSRSKNEHPEMEEHACKIARYTKAYDR
jgi:hypothetical protein